LQNPVEIAVTITKFLSDDFEEGGHGRGCPLINFDSEKEQWNFRFSME